MSCIKCKRRWLKRKLRPFSPLNLLVILMTLYGLYQMVIPFIINLQDDEIRLANGSSIRQFDPSKHFIVFIHIQKTSGTSFDQYIVDGLYYIDKKANKLNKACNRARITRREADGRDQRTTREFLCARPGLGLESWYMSWHSTFGLRCGLHPYYSDLKGCIEQTYYHIHKSKFFYITLLRDPVKRFLSEFLHIKQTGSTWVRDHPLMTQAQNCSIDFLDQCNRTDWTSISLDQFIKCKQNLAINRQTRMLAKYDSEFTVCHYFNHSNEEIYNQELLRRAKLGLESLFMFGLTEYQSSTRDLFHAVFNNALRLEIKPMQKKQRKTELLLSQLAPAKIEQIKQLNKLDVVLYSFAKQLFFKRLQYYGIDAKE